MKRLQYLETASLTVVLCVASFAAGCSKDPESAKREYLRSGNRYFDQQKYNEAIVQYRNALQQDARFGEARLKLAEAHERTGDARAAMREYVRAADALPGSVQAQVKAGAYLLAAGQFEDARAAAERALATDPASVDAQIVLGNALAGLRDFEGAVKEFEEALKLDPKSASALGSLGAVHLARGARPDAEASFRKAVETNPRLPAAHMALANYLWAAGRLPEAEASLKEALAIEPGNMLAHRALAAFYVASKRAPEAEPHMKALADDDTSAGAPFKLGLADYYVALNRMDDAMRVLSSAAQRKEAFSFARSRQAVIEYTRKGTVEGHRIVDEVLARDPKNLAALLVKTEFLLKERKPDEALKYARKVTATHPGSIQGHFLAGSIYRLKNQRDEAIQAFTQVLKLNPRAVAAQVQLSELNLARGQRNTALQLAEDASRAVPNDPGVKLVLVRSLLANGQLARAEQEIKSLVQRYPGAAPVHVAAGAVSIGKGDRAGARRAFTKAFELDSKSLDALAGLVSVDLAEKKPDAARARVEQQLAAAPDDATTLLMAARVYAAVGDGAKSENALKKVIEHDPSNLQAYGMLGQLYASQRRLSDARRNFEEVLKTQPKSVPTHTTVAILYEMEGKRSEARARYERVLQIDPTAAVAANNLAYIYAEDGGNLDIALQLAQTAKQKLPEVPSVIDTVAWVYYKKDLPELAVPLFEEAIRKEPKNPTYRFHLGLALLKAGEKLRARQAFEAVVNGSPDAPEAGEARKALATM
jgi:tetratricopeptide (TPR) repeat protein